MSKGFSVFTFFKAKDGVTPVFKNMTKGAGGFQNRLGVLSNSASNFGNTMQGTLNKLKVMAGAVMGFFAISKIKDFVGQTTEAAEQELAAQTKLTNALKNNANIRAKGTEAYKKIADDLIKTASDIQQKGIIGDEVLVGGMQTLGNMGFDDSVIKKMTPIIADLAVQQKGYNVTITDTENIAKGLGRALAGNAGALSRMGVVLNDNQKKAMKNMSAQKRAAFIYEILQKRVGGLNEAFGKSDRGAKVQWLNNWSDRLEDVGKRIIPLEWNLFRFLNKLTPALSTGIDKFFDGLEYGIKQMQPVWDAFKESFAYLGEHLIPELSGQAPLIKGFFEGVFVPGLTLVIEGFTELFKVIDKTYNFIKDNWIPIVSVLAGVGGMLALKNAFDAVSGAIAWYNTSIMIAGKNGVAVVSGFSKLKFVLGGYTQALLKSVAAIWAQTTALLANPWTWVAVAIAAVVAGAILIWKNWDKITEVMGEWWNNIQEWLVGFWSKCTEVFAAVSAVVQGWLTGFWNKTVETFTKIGDTIKGWISGFWETVKSIFSLIGNFIKDNFINILLGALGPIGLVIRGLMKIGEKLGVIKGQAADVNLDGVNANNDAAVRANYNPPGGGANSISGNLNVGVTIDNSTAFPATSSLNLTGAHNLNLVPG